MEQRQLAKAIKSIKSKQEGELSFKKGEFLTITNSNPEKGLLQGEYLGKKGTKSGWLPNNAVKYLTDKEVEELKSNKTYQKEQEKKKQASEKFEKERQEKERLEKEKESKKKSKEISGARESKGESSSNTATSSFLKKYKKETTILNDKIANRPTKQTLIDKGIFIDVPDAAATVKQPNFSFGSLLSPKPSKDSPKQSPAYKPSTSSVFGVPLGQVMFTSYTNFTVPNFIMKMIKHIAEKGVKETGIFRVSGGAAEMNEIKEFINRSEVPDLSKYSVHSVAGVLKLFFRQLPEPLFTFDLFDPFMKALEISNRESKIERFSMLLKQLPPINYVLLSKLIILLGKVCKFSDENKMTSSNIGIVFGPTLFWQKDSNIMSEMMGNTNTSDAVSLLVEEYEILFKEMIEEEDKTQYTVNAKQQAAHGRRLSQNLDAIDKKESSFNPAELPEPVDSIPLPVGWEIAQDNKGRMFYIDHNTKTTSWTDPRRVHKPMRKSTSSLIELPPPLIPPPLLSEMSNPNIDT